MGFPRKLSPKNSTRSPGSPRGSEAVPRRFLRELKREEDKEGRRRKKKEEKEKEEKRKKKENT